MTTVVTSKDAPVSLNSEPQEKLNNAARIFLERSREYDNMIEDARSEYRIGLRHLANMMGADPETFTQNDANVSSFRGLLPFVENFSFNDLS